MGYRAYPGSEFVVANTLAKWKKLEPNENNFSQKVVSTFNFLSTKGDFCRAFSSNFGKRPLAKLEKKRSDLTSKLGEINDREHNKSSKIYHQIKLFYAKHTT